MARLLAIDFGTKRSGIAVTDELQIIASGLTTVFTDELISFLVAYIAKIVGKVSPLDLKMEMQILPYLVAQLLGC